MSKVDVLGNAMSTRLIVYSDAATIAQQQLEALLNASSVILTQIEGLDQGISRLSVEVSSIKLEQEGSYQICLG